MLVLLLIPLAAAYRILFRRPWRVYAESVDGRDVLLLSVVGWEASGEAIQRAAADIRATGAPQSDDWVKLALPLAADRESSGQR